MSDDSSLFKNFGSIFNPGDSIFIEGEKGDMMYIIQSGKVKIVRKFGEKEYVLSILEKGNFFGEMAIVMKDKRTASAIAVTKVEVLGFDRDGFESMIKKNSKIALNIIDKLCRRLWSANQQVRLLVRKNKSALVAMNLIHMFKGINSDKTELPYDKILADMSENLELPLELVESLFDSLQKDGIINIKGNTLLLLDAGKLTELAEHAVCT
ncbi:MAG: Crp/Fnr family transcriptional regulator [Spirochaetales bacterium]|nr:Crp/Fnr family transcriptional regulator [Spirochaetales bacterium]